jgi:hypothetical protein
MTGNPVEHTWKEVVRHDGVKGLYCVICELFIKETNTKLIRDCNKEKAV